MASERSGRAGSAPSPISPADAAGLAARELAVEILSEVLTKGATLDNALSLSFARGEALRLAPRDRAFARHMATTVLRRHGELAAVVNSFLSKPIPAKFARVQLILLSGAAQLLLIGTPAHAAISLSVELARLDRRTAHLDRLTNAVLRAVSREGDARLRALDGVKLDVPAWMLDRWTNAYGLDEARRIAEASLEEPGLDLTVKEDAERWADRLGGVVLPTGSVRLAAVGSVDQLPGYAEGAWWVQDAAAALPARLLGDVRNFTVADLCAAPGGKSLQLAAAGARVTAVDQSERRLPRLRENLERTGLAANCVTADATTWSPPEPFDRVLLDAPCTATGTIRRHPDILHLKRPEDLTRLVPLQAALLDNAARLVRPGGLLVYCTCSLEPEEGEEQVASFLTRHKSFERVPVEATELGVAARSISAAGDLRLLPHHLEPRGSVAGGVDGFFAARLRRRG